MAAYGSPAIVLTTPTRPANGPTMGRWSVDFTITPAKATPDVIGLLSTAVVLPPDSEVVPNFSINGGQLGTCALINPNRGLTEEFGVVVGHTLVDASMPSASVLIINPNAEEVVLPCGSRIGNLVPVSAVSVARSELQLPTKTTTVLPDYLEDIVNGSHTSLRYRSSIYDISFTFLQGHNKIIICCTMYHERGSLCVHHNSLNRLTLTFYHGFNG